MTSHPHPASWRMLMLSTLLATFGTSVAPVLAQAPATDVSALRERVERRFDVLPLHDGVVLRPRARSDIRSIEVSGGTVAIDGQPVTGAELRTRLGDDADLVLQTTYLDAAGRRALSGRTGASAPASPAAATPSSSPAPAVPPVEPEPPVPPAPPDPPAAPERRSRRDRGSGDDRVRFGGSIDVDEGEVVNGDVVAIGGSIDVKGHVTGDVVAVGGSVDLGPSAIVERDVVAVGGSIDRAEGARVDGDVTEVSIGRGLAGAAGWHGGMTKELGREMWRPFGSAFSLLATLVRVGVLCLLAAIVLLFGRDYAARIEERAVAEPLKAGLVGLLAQVLFVPLLIVVTITLVVTIIGIPLLVVLPFAVLALMALAFVGFTAVASRVGRWAAARSGWTGYSDYATTAAGIVLLALPLILAKLVGLGGNWLWVLSYGLAAVGFLVEYIAWTVGIGAVALTRFAPRVATPTEAAA